MKSLIKRSVLCCAMLFCGTASADFTAGELRDFCTTGDARDLLVCLAYINGYRAGHLTGVYGAKVKLSGPSLKYKKLDFDEDLQRYSAFCDHYSVTHKQVYELFVKYMNDHPEKLHEEAGNQLMHALIHYFPCKSGTKGGMK